MTAPTRLFGSRLGMMLAMLGMAVGTGNIWRFPRIVARNGGGSFLIAWLTFLLLWSIPLILLELGMARKTRSGPIRSFIEMLGPKRAWMGAFCVLVTAMILFYYSVVAGWTVRYSIASLTGEIPEDSPGSFFTSFTGGYGPLLVHALMIVLGCAVVARGVGMIERVARVLMPALIVLVLVLTGRALMLPGAADGLGFLFRVEWSQLASATTWVEALTQNAWDTGAGWGLVLCYAVYQREKEDTALNGVILPVANNCISLLAGIMVFATVFSVVPILMEQAADDPSVLAGLGSLGERVQAGEAFSAQLMTETVFAEGNTGITFTWMPQLFASLAGGRFFMTMFFMALAFAAFTSLVAMIELVTRSLQEFGVTRPRAVLIVGAAGILLGLPSALNMDVFDNQDWAWGVALMLAGLFFALSVTRFGIRRFRETYINHADSDIRIGRWWDVVIGIVVPVEAVVLFVWLLVQARRENPDGWLHPFATYNVGTVLFQVGLALVALLLANRWVARRAAPPEAAPTDPVG